MKVCKDCHATEEEVGFFNGDWTHCKPCHYRRKREYEARAKVLGTLQTSTLERIATKFDMQPNGCWIWRGVIQQDGYGRYNGRRAHIVMYELMKGPVPEGKALDHVCQTKLCVNPE